MLPNPNPHIVYCVFVHLCAKPPLISEDVRGQESAISATSGTQQEELAEHYYRVWIAPHGQVGAHLHSSYCHLVLVLVLVLVQVLTGKCLSNTIPHTVTSCFLTTPCSCCCYCFFYLYQQQEQRHHWILSHGQNKWLKFGRPRDITYWDLGIIRM